MKYYVFVYRSLVTRGRRWIRADNEAAARERLDKHLKLNYPGIKHKIELEQVFPA